MLIVNSANFRKEVLESKIPVLVDFYAEWCPPCKVYAPAFEMVGGKFSGKAKFVKTNVDEAINIAREYEVMSIPTTILFKSGKHAGSFVGAMSAADLENWLKERV